MDLGRGRLPFLDKLTLLVEPYNVDNSNLRAPADSTCWKCGDWFDVYAHDGCTTAPSRSSNDWSWCRGWLCADCIWYADWEAWSFKKAGRRLARWNERHTRGKKHESMLKQQLEASKSKLARLGEQGVWGNLRSLEVAHCEQIRDETRAKEWTMRVTERKCMEAATDIGRMRRKCLSVWFLEGTMRARRAAQLLLILEKLGLPRDVSWPITALACWIL